MKEPLRIRPLAVGDACALARCFQRCYGNSYADPTFYDPAMIRARVVEGRLRSVVAVNESGEIVGHMGLTLRHPRALTADAGNTVVDPRYRNRSLAGRIGLQLMEVSRDAGLVGFHHYPTTAHPIMQKLAVAGGGVATGIMLQYIPADTDYKALADSAGTGRLAVVVIYQPLAPAPAREVCVPSRYEGCVSAVYRGARLERRAVDPAPGVIRAVTGLTSRFEERRALLRIEVEAIGADLVERVDGVIGQTAADVVHLDLPLADPAVAVAVEEVRRRGFFYAAVMPEYLDGDILRLQKLAGGRAGAPLPELATEEAQSMLDVIVEDAGYLAKG